jgi:hypothetical protein
MSDDRGKAHKMSVSFEAELGQAIRDAAERSGKGLSGWLAEAAAQRLRAEAFEEFLAAWEAEYGALTADDFAEARRRLGIDDAERRAA